MVLIPDSLKAEWRAKVDDLNIDLGHTCTLVFQSANTQVTNVTLDPNGIKPHVVRPFGGRVQGFHVPGHSTMSPNTTNSTQTIQNDQTTKNITCRVYHIPKDYERYNLNVAENVSVYEVITNKKYIPDLQRAKHIILYSTFKERTIAAKLIRPPVPYGLGDLHQSRSFWEEI